MFEQPHKPADHVKSTFFAYKPIRSAVASLFTVSLMIGSAYAEEADQSSSSIDPAAEAPATQPQVEAGRDETTEAPATTSNAASDAPEAALAGVVVTANRREENVQEVSSAITVLDGKELQDKSIGRSASEVLNFVPNASANTQFNGRPRWWIRGVGAGQQQADFPSPIGFYRDDVYISNASATGFPIFDLERVEVLRGPQGTLWGKNTTGGAINIISKKPSFNQGENYVRLDKGSFNETIVQGAIGGEILSERIAGRLSFYNQDRDGYLTNEFDGDKAGAIKDKAVRGQLLFQLSPDLEAILRVSRRDYKEDGNIYTTTGTGPGGAFRFGFVPNRSINKTNSNAETNAEVTQNSVSVQLNWQLGKLALTSITAYEDWDRRALSDGDNTPLEISRTFLDSKSKQISQEFRLASPREDRWNWLTGIHLFKENINQFNAQARLPNGSVPQFPGAGAVNTVPVSFGDTNFDHETTSFGIFGSTTYNFTQNFDTTLGARWTTEKRDLDITRRAQSGGGINAASWGNLGSWWNTYNGPFTNPGSGVITNFNGNLSQRWNAFTYDVTPQYKINETNRVFFKYARGLKSGGFNTAAQALEALNEVDQEQLNSYEIGYKSEWLEGRLNFNATVFYYDYKDVQVNVVGPSAGIIGQSISYLQNADEASVKGLELEFEALPTNNLRLLGNIGLQSSEFQKFQVINNGPVFDGNRLVRTPNVTTFFAADYRIPLSGGNKVVLGADWRYQGRQYYFVNAQNAAQNPNYKLLGEDAYSIVNVRATYSTPGDKVAVSAYVNNLFDKEFIAHALPAGGATGATSIFGLPRTVGVSLTLRY